MSTYLNGIIYEEIVQALYQALLEYEGVENINVQHNVTLSCKFNATAQFDVFWEFKKAGIVHRVAVECKNYNRCVTEGQVREFATKLQDVGNMIGIMVTRIGYQSGAIETAKQHGIYLKKFQFPCDIDWRNKVRKASMTIHCFTLENIKCNFKFDIHWLSEYFKTHEKLTVKINAYNDTIFLINGEGKIIKSLWNIENELPRGEKTMKKLKYSFPMGDDTFLKIPDYDPIKLSSIDYEYDVNETIENVSVSADEIIRGLLSDIDGQENFFFFLDNSILKIDKTQ